MSINKKIKKYTKTVEIPEASRVLPEGIALTEKKKKFFNPYMWAPIGTVAVAGIVAAVALNANHISKTSDSNSAPMRDGVIGEHKLPAANSGIKDEYYYEAEDSYTEGIMNGGLGYGELTTEAINGAISVGTLTGGEIKDLENWNNWVTISKSGVLSNWNINAINRVDVHLYNGETPLNNVKVNLLSNGERVYQAVSNVKGNAYLLYNVDANGQEIKPDSIEIDGTIYNLANYLDSNNHMEIELKDVTNKEIKLDLMFVVDTTGSMDDELTYLQVELEDVINRVENETGVDIRTSVNFYRDEGDEYVVKYYDFRDDEKEITNILMEQTADGGGDYEEAVHTALDNAINEHNWSDESTVKLMFIVLDAPPHNTSEISSQLKSLMLKASAEGIRIIPIAASGADSETQQLLRAFAVMTGGTYIFLDDNSGVGNSHDVPIDKNEYNSETLNNMLIRIIGEYCGEEIDPVYAPETTTEHTHDGKQCNCPPAKAFEE